MKKLQLLTIALACTSLLVACSTQVKTNGKATESTKMVKETDKLSHKKEMKDDQMSDAKQMNDGKKASDFSLMGVDGKTYNLSDFKGKKVYLKFWASWCPICLAGLEEVDGLAKDAPADTVILSVVSPNKKGEQSEEDFKKWYKELGHKNLPVLLDPSGKLIEEYGVRVYPTSAFIGSDGIITKVMPGHMEKADILNTFETIK
ncbi:redoxin family protein [Streptococcus ovis]|uniref:redoxin family protein n=1 Tax=Streptococcus ovis TaxID=82806 RepID=UPI00037FB9AA|nr:redoxin family protein [Streptococcus ovis]